MSDVCPKCGRNLFHQPQHERWCAYDLTKCKAYVVHEYYGCDTGCCGHKGYLRDENGLIVDWTDFSFAHPYDMSDENKRRFVESMVGRWSDVEVDWERCELYED
jgi:hypothetical protein